MPTQHKTRFQQYSLRTLLVLLTLAALAFPAFRTYRAYQRSRRPYLEEQLAKTEKELGQFQRDAPLLWSNGSAVSIHSLRVNDIRNEIATLETHIAELSPSDGEEIREELTASLTELKAALTKEENSAAELQDYIDTYERLRRETERLKEKLAD